MINHLLSHGLCLLAQACEVLGRVPENAWIFIARKKASIITSAVNSLMEKNDEPPSRDEVAKVMGISIEELDKMMSDVSFASFLSLEGMRSDSDDGQMKVVDSIKNPKATSPLGELESSEEKELLDRAISELPKQEKIAAASRGLMWNMLATATPMTPTDTED